jgi:hypothetical protein
LGYLCGEVGEDPDHLKCEEYLERQTEKNEVFIFNKESQFRRTKLLEKWSSSLTNIIGFVHEPRGRRQPCILYKGKHVKTFNLSF